VPLGADGADIQCSRYWCRRSRSDRDAAALQRPANVAECCTVCYEPRLHRHRVFVEQSSRTGGGCARGLHFGLFAQCAAIPGFGGKRIRFLRWTATLDYYRYFTAAARQSMFATAPVTCLTLCRRGIGHYRGYNGQWLPSEISAGNERSSC
jgi:hypothetical protein